MIRAHVRQAAKPDAPATRGLATAAIRIAIAPGRGEHTQGATGEAVGQDLCGYVVDGCEVLLDLRVGAGLWWGTMHTGASRGTQSVPLAVESSRGARPIFRRCGGRSATTSTR